MRELLIDGYLIECPVGKIIETLQSELTNGRLRDIKGVEGVDSNITVTCPFHKNGKESKPSANVYVGDDESVPYGFFRCFTCGEQGPFQKFVGACLGFDEAAGAAWLIDRFGKRVGDARPKLQFIPQQSRVSVKDLMKSGRKPEFDRSAFEPWHPYLQQRKLSRSVCEEFGVSYDPATKSIVFPVWDADGNYKFNARRSVETKRFMIDKDAEKPVYLLNFVLEKGIRDVIVAESQINALYCWSLGYPAIALFGTGSADQYEILKRTPISRYVLGFDGDAAGQAGAERFRKRMPKGVLIDSMAVPFGKDLNDLSPQEIAELHKKAGEAGISGVY